ncbi:Alpha/Beta hydrolase protein [Xylariales sp. PMI_506]|nr:Alpha/Beta hydrolase protein [Xylariales sp. PMI_506]
MDFSISATHPKPPGRERRYPEPTNTGKVVFKVPGYNLESETYYKVYGDLDSNRPPLICLHGGPGVPHGYLVPISMLLVDCNISVIIYDQIGNGSSTHLPEFMGNEAFWTPELFMAELDNLIRSLGLKQYDLFGQSWGAMLAAQYAATMEPEGLRKLIISSAPASMDTWLKVLNDLRKYLPASVQEALDKGDKDGSIATPEYREAMNVFYKRHLCRLEPFPKELTDTFKEGAKDKTVYMTMLGLNDFLCTGTLAEWSIEEDLKKLTPERVPGGILLLNGRFDQAQPETMQPFFDKPSAKVKWVEFALSSHVPHLEEHERFIKVLGDFLKL